MIITTVWMAAIGFLDDYIKVFKKNKKGLSPRFKIIGQVLLGLIVASFMLFHPDIVIQENASHGTSHIEFQQQDQESCHTD